MRKAINIIEQGVSADGQRQKKKRSQDVKSALSRALKCVFEWVWNGRCIKEVQAMAGHYQTPVQTKRKSHSEFRAPHLASVQKRKLQIS